jgi:hypothetical protein
MGVVGYSLKYMHFQWISNASVACFRGVLPGVVMLLFCQLLMLGLAVPYCKASSHQRAILILYSNEYELPANQLISRGLQEGLRDAAKVISFTEFLDATRFPERYQDGSLASFIHEKYTGQKFHLLIAVGPRAAAIEAAIARPSPVEIHVLRITELPLFSATITAYLFICALLADGFRGE